MKAKITFGKYNVEYFSTPWGANVYIKDRKLAYKFDKGEWIGTPQNGGAVYIDCAPGEVIAYGQKDQFCDEKTVLRWFLVLDEENLKEFTKEEAYDYIAVSTNLPVRKKRERK